MVVSSLVGRMQGAISRRGSPVAAVRDVARGSVERYCSTHAIGQAPAAIAKGINP
jgi:hypothetical protein